MKIRELVYVGVFVVLVVLGVVWAGSAEAADGDHAPFQLAHAGNWYDPAHPGVGVDVLPYDTDVAGLGAFVTVYGGQVPNTGGIPVWFAAQPAWHGNAPVSSPLLITGQTFGGSGVAAGTAVGNAVFDTDPAGCDHLSLDLTFGEGTVFGATQHYDLIALVQPLRDTCFFCPAVQFGPFDDRCIDVGP